MNQAFRKATLTIITLQLSAALGAHAQVDPLRCEAKSLRCESKFYECLARCDRQMQSQPDKAADTLKARHDRCEATCEEHHSKKMATIKTTPPCKDIEVAPNPRECEARFLRIEAGYMICEARCDGRSNPSDCRDACTTRYQTNADELKAEPVCKDGRVTNGPTSF